MTIKVNKKFDNVDAGIENMLAAAVADYATMSFGKNSTMLDDFTNGWVVKKGSKYIKISTKNSAWGFVVNTDDDKKFMKGDVLMCAGYKAPARNGARGNVLEGGFEINWTGPLYMVNKGRKSTTPNKIGV
jgi:hypothetical protein